MIRQLLLSTLLLSGCYGEIGDDDAVQIEAPKADAPLVAVKARLEVVCDHGEHGECFALVVCRDCDPATEECEAWQGECHLFEEPGQ